MSLQQPQKRPLHLALPNFRLPFPSIWPQSVTRPTPLPKRWPIFLIFTVGSVVVRRHLEGAASLGLTALLFVLLRYCELA